MTLALLLTAVTGAWAQSSLSVVELEVPAAWANDNSNMTAADLPGFKAVTKEEINDAWDAPAGEAKFIYAFNGDNASYVFFVDGLPNDDVTTPFQKNTVFNNSKSGVKFYYTAEPTVPSEPTEWSLTPGSSANTWTFAMPGSDVVLTPIYAKAAAFATTGTEPEVKTLLPAAAEGVIAGTDASLIAEGTGIVAFAGTSTEVTQGTLMYAIGTSATEAPALTAFSATVPTAKNIADDGATVYVWYYIQGADAPQGEAATLDNTFDNTEPACLTVQVLTNKFDIQFNAANANTIEAGKATVTVGGTAATVTEGKLEGVKMGSEVKVKAKDGYKFRKVEVKKGAGDAGKSLAEATVGMIIGSDGKAYAADDKDNLPEGVTVAAKVCYVDGNGHGLALALTDEVDKMNWSTAQTTCDAHTPAITGGTWKLASQGEWNNMISAAGSHTALRDGFSSVGGTNMQSEGYWSSTEDDSSDAWNYYFSNGLWSDVSKNWNRCVRACLAF